MNYYASKRNVLTPELINLIWQIPCLVETCEVPYEHWTIEHECQICKHLGHSQAECANDEAIRILNILIDLQFNPGKRERLINAKSSKEIKRRLQLIPEKTRKESKKWAKPKMPKISLSKPNFILRRKGYIRI